MMSFQEIKPITQFALHLVGAHTVYFEKAWSLFFFFNAGDGSIMNVLFLLASPVLPGISVVHGILGVGFVLLSFALLVFMTHSFIKYHMKHRASNLSKTHTFHGKWKRSVCTDYMFSPAQSP